MMVHVNIRISSEYLRSRFNVQCHLMRITLLSVPEDLENTPHWCYSVQTDHIRAFLIVIEQYVIL